MKKRSLVILLACTLGILGIKYLNNGVCSNAAEINDNTKINNEITTSAAVSVKSQLGEVLKSPEAGWNRYDDRNLYIEYPEEAGRMKCDEDGRRKADGETMTIMHVKDDTEMKFSFTGTKLRLIGAKIAKDNYVYADEEVTKEISFDGGKTFEKLDLYSDYDSEYGINVVTYEKSGLSNEKHDVIIRCSTTNTSSYQYEEGIYFKINAIDVDGELQLRDEQTIPVDHDSESKLGKDLEWPQEGWNRYEDTDPHIKYSKEVDKDYFGNQSMTQINLYDNADIRFSFTGTKLRLIGAGIVMGRIDTDNEISFDGGKTFEKLDLYHKSWGWNTVTYEKTGLSDEKHDVIIKFSTDDLEISSIYDCQIYYDINAIDVDGELV